MGMQPKRQIVRNLAAHGDHDAMRMLDLEYVQHPFKGQLIEIQAVAHVIIRGDRLRIVIDQDAPVPMFLDRLEARYRTPVEFH